MTSDDFSMTPSVVYGRVFLYEIGKGFITGSRGFHLGPTQKFRPTDRERDN
jgi:hypothetical protein